MGVAIEHLLPLSALIAGAVLLYVLMFRSPVVFQIQYRNGIPRVTRGRVTEGLRAAIQEICHQNEIRKGTITALPNGKRVRMTFSRDIPPGCQQQIRNLMLLDQR